MKAQTELNITAIGSFFAWIFLVLLVSEIHNVKYDVINGNTLTVASFESPIEYQDIANLICEGDCAEDLNTLLRFVPRTGGTIQFCPNTVVEIGSSIIIPNASRLMGLTIRDAYFVMLPECDTALVVE